AWLPRALSRRLRERDPLPPWSWVFVIGWTGMRGIVSLAAALALPYTIRDGVPFPARDAIVFITFVVIFVTLVGQGLSLIPIVKWLKLGHDENDGEEREIEVRIAALEAGVREIGDLAAQARDDEERRVVERLRGEYVHRIDHLRGHGIHGRTDETAESEFDHRAQSEALRAERREIARLRSRGEIPDDLFRRIQYDLDLAEARMF
ncbi:MAG: cation:proton antiporter, partial [Candidatus Eremiobacteraeota bacterium]|nr:cation:proton antiporter [Candidatus Eremiobacteraeota bacterium]